MKVKSRVASSLSLHFKVAFDGRTTKSNLIFFFYCRTTNIMDNMLKMMERYSARLEDVVAERTAQLAEEKRKTDSLLYRMLPQ